jgi:EAL and modified HD-GYP domain-containing signal transduction protein
MLDNTVLFGFDQLTSGLPAFVNCTREALIENLVCVLPPAITVLEILEDIDPTPDLIAACRALKGEGYRLALDDFTWKPGYQPLIDIADFIKVDFTLSKADDRRQLMNRVQGMGKVMLAEKIETQEEYDEARKEGFKLIQGYFFCRPVMLENRKVPVNRLSQVEILRALQAQDLDIRNLARLVKRDASLTHRLLRLINSPLCAIRQEVRSVQSAILAIGEGAFRRIATLAITSELNSSQPSELLRMAFVRGRFCELTADLCSRDSTEQYLLGLLSLLPAMLRIPMEELAPSLPLRNEIRMALCGEPNRERSQLDWLISHEHGDWGACDIIASERNLNQQEMIKRYEEALAWAETALHFS